VCKFFIKARRKDIKGRIKMSTLERLIKFWQFHRGFDANMADLARYTRVSRDTVYRWLNRKAQPKEQKITLIKEWLDLQNAP
jgi:transcriptional regulator with XRE-family HTH domain